MLHFLQCSLLPKKVTEMLDHAHYAESFFINFYANKNVLSGITTTYMLQLIFFISVNFCFSIVLGYGNVC